MKAICNLFPLFIIVSAVMFFACEKDQSIVEENETPFKSLDVIGHVVKGDSIRQINKDLDLFLRERFEHKDRFSSENLTSNVYGFTVNTDRVFQLNGETYTNYIFNISRNNPISGGFENYMLTVFDDGRYMQVLIYYPLIESDYGLIADINGATVTYINDDSLLTGIESSPCGYTSEEIIEWSDEADCIYFNCTAGGNHSYGQSCSGSPGEQPFKICYGGWVVTGCTNGGSSGSGSTNPTDPFPPTGNGGNPTNPVDPNIPNEEVPTVPLIPAWQEVENCMNSASFTENIQLTPAMISWLETYNLQAVNTMNTILQEYSCSEEAQEDVFNEINELMENSFIETTMDHFSVDEITNDCLLRVVRDEIINKLNAGIINSIRNTIGQQSNYNLAFRHNNTNNGQANAGTAMPAQGFINNGEYPIIVNFANDYLSGNPTKLSLAATTIHEMVHARLIYLYFEGELLQKYPNFTDLKSKFDIFITNRNEINNIALEDSMHIAMVDLIGTMSYALFKYAKDNRMENVTYEYCKDITKGTFSGTPAMNVITPDVNLQTDYILKAQNEQNNTSDAKGKDC